MKEFSGRVAIVTGGSGGIGRAAALAFARKGAKVAVADILIEAGEETVQMIKNDGAEAIFVKTDVSNPAEVKALVDKAVKTYGSLDYAHNNAGIDGAQALTADYPEEMWNRVLSINLTGVWLCMKHEIPQMLKQGKGAIVNTASVGGFTALSKIAAYTAAKFGVIGITKTAALEYATQGIRVNAVCPGIISTPMTENLDQEKKSSLLDMIPMERFGKPEDVAWAVLFLASEDASYITGETIVVSGGAVTR